MVGFFRWGEFGDAIFTANSPKAGSMKQNSTLNFDFKVLDLVLMGRTPYKKPFELDSQADYELQRLHLLL